MLRKFIGDRAFYRRLMLVAVPIIVQYAITNFVSLLDNIMVGQVGTLSMSGVAIVNQLLFVFNLCVFGAASGAGLYTAQFHGNEDPEGVRYTFRFKILSGTIIGIAGISLFLAAGPQLIGLFMQGDNDPAAVAETMEHAMTYLKVMLFGLIPFALSNAYSGTLRESGQTVVPMVAGIAAVLTNLVLNYILIFGHLGAPAMGVRGAAMATVISRFVELAIVGGWTHLNGKKPEFIRGAYRSFYIPKKLLGEITLRTLPLMANELLFSLGLTVMNQCYSTRGLDVVAAVNICSTLSNLANVMYHAMGNVVSIIIGQMLGARKPEDEVWDTDRKLIAFSVMSCLVCGSLLALISGLFPKIYNTTDDVRAIATALICVNAVVMPFNAVNFGCYFTLRAGGKTLLTFLSDSGFIWAVSVPLAFILSRLTGMAIIPMYALCMSADILKSVFGIWLVKKGTWIRSLARN